MKIEEVKTLQDAELYCEGIVNDFQSGIINRVSFMAGLRDYTFHLHDMFNTNAKKKLIDKFPNSELLKLGFTKEKKCYCIYMDNGTLEFYKTGILFIGGYEMASYSHVFEKKINSINQLKSIVKLLREG